MRSPGLTAAVEKTFAKNLPRKGGLGCSSPSHSPAAGGGFSSGVLLGSSGVLLCYRTPEERQKNTRRTQKNPEEPRRRRTPAPPRLYKLFVLFAWGVGTCVTWPMTWPVLFWRAPSPRGPGDDMRYETIPNERRRRPHRDMLLHRAFSASTIKPQQTSVPHCSS